jgi:3-dehydroquinate synthase
MAADLSAEVLGFPAADVERVRQLVRAIGCPDVGPKLSGPEQWLELMRGDKKSRAGEITFVLMPRIGESIRRTVPEDAVKRVLARRTA